MKIPPIIAVLVMFSSLAYAEKSLPQPREKKAPSHVDRKKPPVRPVTPKPATVREAKPTSGAATGAAGATSPKQTPPAQNLVQGNLIGTDAARSTAPASAHEAAPLNPAPGAAPKPVTDAGISKPLNSGTQVPSGTETAKTANPNQVPSAQGDNGVDRKPASWSDDWVDEGVSRVRAGKTTDTARQTPNSSQPRSLTDDFGGVPLNRAENNIDNGIAVQAGPSGTQVRSSTDAGTNQPEKNIKLLGVDSEHMKNSHQAPPGVSQGSFLVGGEGNEAGGGVDDSRDLNGEKSTSGSAPSAPRSVRPHKTPSKISGDGVDADDIPRVSKDEHLGGGQPSPLMALLLPIKDSTQPGAPRDVIAGSNTDAAKIANPNQKPLAQGVSQNITRDNVTAGKPTDTAQQTPPSPTVPSTTDPKTIKAPSKVGPDVRGTTGTPQTAPAATPAAQPAKK